MSLSAAGRVVPTLSEDEDDHSDIYFVHLDCCTSILTWLSHPWITPMCCRGLLAFDQVLEKISCHSFLSLSPQSMKNPVQDTCDHFQSSTWSHTLLHQWAYTGLNQQQVTNMLWSGFVGLTSLQTERDGDCDFKVQIFQCCTSLTPGIKNLLCIWICYPEPIFPLHSHLVFF